MCFKCRNVLWLKRRLRKYVIAVCLLVLLCTILYIYVLVDHNQALSPYTLRQFEEDPPGRKKVLLVTYTRGGSSLLGEAFNQNNESLYWYEPLYGLYVDLYGAHVTNHGVQGVHRKLPRYEETAVIDTVLDMFNCRLHALSPGVLFNRLQPMLRGIMPKSADQFINCLWKKPVNDTWHPDPTTCASLHLTALCPKCFSHNTCYSRLHETRGFWEGTAHLRVEEQQYVQCMSEARKKVERCLPILEERCHSSQLHSAKLVRLRMPTANLVLTQDTSIRIIHLLRDPRGILNSRHRDARNRDEAMVSDAKILCPTILQDLQVSDNIQKLHHNAILTLKYEDVVSDPIRNLDRIYQHLKLETPSSVKQWFNSTMKHGETKSGGSSTRKKDPQTITFKWQSTMSKETLNAINGICGQAIAKSGYWL